MNIHVLGSPGTVPYGYPPEPEREEFPMAMGWIGLILGTVTLLVTSCGTGGTPQPKFTVTPAEGVAPLTVTCENLSPERYPLGLFKVRWQWSFGDGSPDSAERQPVHTYEQPGEYTLRLTASTPLGSRSAEQVVRVTAPEPGDDGGDGGGDGDGEGDGGGDGGGGDGGGGETDIPPRFSRTFNVTTCAPELPVEVTLLLEYRGTATMTALGLVETLPDGWSFEGLVSGTVDLVRQNGNDVEFAWITPPAFPVSLTYRVRAPADLSGNQVFSGILYYRFDAGGLSYGPVTTALASATGSDGPNPSPDALLTRVFSTGDIYTPGEPITVTLTMAYAGLFPLSSLGIRETLPDGWTLGEIAGNCPPPVFRQNGRDAEFAWIDLPSLPCSFTYQVWPPVNASGLAGFSGVMLFRAEGGEQTSIPFVGVLSPASPDGPPDTRVTVPAVTGMTAQAAAQALAAAGLNTGEVLWEHRDTVAAGVVSAQFPPAGALVVPGSAVTLTVSLGPPPQPENDYAAETLVNLRRDLLVQYEPGKTVDMAVTFEKRGGREVATLTFRETLPDGWTFAGVASGPPPSIAPEAGTGGALAFTWLAPETFPFTCVYRVNVPQDATGSPEIGGQIQFQTAGGTIGTTPAAATRLVRVDSLDTVVAAGLSEVVPEGYRPGQPVSVTLSVTRMGGSALSALGVTLYLPTGWTWNGVTAGTVPPIIRPDADKVEFAWITPPALPGTFTVSVQPPAGDTASRGMLSCQSQGRAAIGSAIYGPLDSLVVPRLVTP
ncbi:MAG TPA: PKD domain-containing protein [Candidatus Hydrogenedentes bacterium]|nr:PKD domain-containing protein [Candidatus Hydrogenedentota bacterium]